MSKMGQLAMELDEQASLEWEREKIDKEIAKIKEQLE